MTASWRASTSWTGTGSSKGATALLARDIGVRATIDIDLYREAVREITEEDVRRAAALDIGDWFRFEIGPPRPIVDTSGARLPVTALVGNTPWAQFHVDLVGTDLHMTGEPENVPPLARVVMPDVTRERIPRSLPTVAMYQFRLFCHWLGCCRRPNAH